MKPKSMTKQDKNGEEKLDNDEHTPRKNKLLPHSKLLEKEMIIRDLNKEITVLMDEIAKQKEKMLGKE